MKSILTKGMLAAAASLTIAGAFAQVQTGTPTNGSALGVTPPPSTSTTTDTSRLSSDCSTVAARQRSHQAGGDQLAANCGNTATTMGATGTATQPATVGNNNAAVASTPSSTGSTGTAMSQDSGSTNMAANDTMAPKHKKAKADRG